MDIPSKIFLTSVLYFALSSLIHFPDYGYNKRQKNVVGINWSMSFVILIMATLILIWTW